jgi:hypothetical protein
VTTGGQQRGDRVKIRKSVVLMVSSLLWCVGASAQALDREPEPAAIVELGGAVARSLGDGGSSGGATAAVEFTPIEKWLELEAGITSLFSHRSREWDADLLFKKPWSLSKKVEFMIGVGPEWARTRQGGMTTNAVAGEAVVEHRSRAASFLLV